MSRPLQKLQRLFRELKRRNVYKVAATYAVVGFVLIQVADLTFVRLGLPSWTVTFLIVLVAMGFPLALVLAWAFERTPEGVRRTAEAEPVTGEAGEAEAGTRPAYKLLVGLGLAAAAVAGGWYLTGGGGQSPEVSDRSVAVLPFDARGQEEPGTLTAGMHAALSSRLGNVSDLRVSPSRAVQAFEDTALSMAEIARELEVAWIVTGNVQTTEEEVQVIVELVDPATGSQRWSDGYTRALTTESLFDLQSEISREIAGSLQAELTPEERERIDRQPTRSLDAYRLYAKGRRLLNSRDEQDLIRATEYFRRAIRADSTYAQPWAGLADAAGLYRAHVSDSLPPSMPNQEGAARRAVELNPELAEARASLGLLHSQNLAAPAALRELSRAVELRPSYAQAHNWLGDMLVHIGRPRPGLTHVTLAIELNPGNPALWDELYRARIANRDYEGALEVADRAPGDGSATNEWYAATALAHLEDWTGVRERIRRVLPDSLSIDTAPYYVLALADVGTGDTTSAQARLRGMQEQIGSVQATPRAWIAVVQEALGQREAALTSLRLAVERAREYARFTILPQILRHYYPDLLASLRSDPRFAELMRDVNLMWGLNPDGSLPDSVDVSFGSESDE